MSNHRRFNKQTITFDTVLKSVFLIILGMTGNFSDKLLGCKLQKLLKNNIYAKHIMLISIIFFTLDFSKDQNIHPKKTFTTALTVWFLVVLVNKMTLKYILTASLLLASIYINRVFIDFYETEDAKFFKKRLEILNMLDNTLRVAFASSIIIGGVRYFIRKRKHYEENFDILTYIFGTITCKHNEQ